MKQVRTLIIVLSAAMLGGLALLLSSRAVPLGVRGEWEWNRLTLAPLAIDVALVVAAVAAYALFVVVGWRSLGRKADGLRQTGWLAALFVLAVALQVFLPSAAPYGYGLTKWSIALFNPGS